MEILNTVLRFPLGVAFSVRLYPKISQNRCEKRENPQLRGGVSTILNFNRNFNNNIFNKFQIILPLALTLF